MTIRSRVVWLIAMAAAVVVTTPTVLAELKWQEKTVSRSARSSDEAVEAVFHFTNRGAAPVTLRDIESSCSCLTASTSKRMYAPGETGEIVARLAIEERMGALKRTLRVVTDAKDDPATVLMFNAQIDPVFSMEPRFAYWQRNAPAEPQIITVRATSGAEFTVKNLRTPPGNFKGRLIEDEPGRVWRVEISPEITTVRTSSIFLLETIGAQGVQKNYSILVRVL